MDARGEERKTAALAAAVFLFALALRLHGLGTVFPVNDEIMQFYEALAHVSWRGFFALLAHNPHHVLLDPLSTRLAAELSQSLFALRLPSALWGALGAWLTCRLGARAGRPYLGLAAGLLLSVSLLHLDWSRRADFYAFLTAVSVWTAVDYFSVLDRPESWPRLALSSVFFLLSHPYAVLMAIFQFTFAFFFVEDERLRESLSALAKAWAVAVVVFLPWFCFSTKALLDMSLFDFRGDSATMGLGAFVSGLPAALAQKPEAGPIPFWAEFACAAAYGAGWIVSLAASLRGKGGRLLAFCHAVLFFGLIAVVAVDLRYHYYLAHRQLLWILPFYLLAVADGWSRLLERNAQRVGILSLAALFAVSLGLSVTQWQEERSAGMARLIGQMGPALTDGAPLSFVNDQLAAGFLFSFDRDAFRRIPDMRLEHGMMSYEFPADFAAIRDGKTFPVEIGRPCVQDAKAWTLCGSIYETSVLPPSGAKRL